MKLDCFTSLANVRKNPELTAKMLGPSFIPRCRKLSTIAFLLPMLVLFGCKQGDHSKEPPLGEKSEKTPAATLEQSIFRLVDVTAQWGVNFTYKNGYEKQEYTILESLGGGIGVLDYTLSV